MSDYICNQGQKSSKSMPILYDYDFTKDSLYLEGRETERAEIFTRLLEIMSINDIVKKFDVSKEYLQELNKEMEG